MSARVIGRGNVYLIEKSHEDPRAGPRLPIGAVAVGVGTYTMIEPAAALCFGRHC